MNNADTIRATLVHNAKLWNRTVSQSEWFLNHMTKDDEDYTEVFEKQGLSSIFTATKIKDGEEVPKIITTKGFNCNHLYRQCLKMPDILIAANDDFIALHPLGEPGLALGYINTRVSHFMVVSRKNIVLNHSLPLTLDEKEFLKKKSQFINDVYDMLFENKKLSECGFTDKKSMGWMKVLEIQMEHHMGICLEMRIRDFIAIQISTLSEDIKTSMPGYKLIHHGVDVSGNSHIEILEMLNDVFDSSKMNIYKCIQGVDKCSQLYSHVHTFLVPNDVIPGKLIEDYMCIDTIIKCSE
jgi:hypothetical protein